MAKGETPEVNSFLKLLVPREEAIRRIKEQMESGRHIRDRQFSSMMDLESALERRTEWLEENAKMLASLFNNPLLVEEYLGSSSIDTDSAITFSLKEKYLKDDMDDQIGKLGSLSERLKSIPEITADELIEQQLREELMRHKPPKPMRPREIQPRAAPTQEIKIREEPSKEEPPVERPPKKAFKELPSKGKPPGKESLKEIFPREGPPREAPLPFIVPDRHPLPGSNILLIHGRDEATKESVLSFIEKLGLRALTLDGAPDEVKNVLEQFRAFSWVDFAIVLFTPDEIAAPRNKPKERQARVSQNVIFEFGYFLGKLGNEKVCALYQEEVEIPSDHPGVVYIPMDSKGGWRLLVAKEIKQAGIEVDLNKAI